MKASSIKLFVLLVLVASVVSACSLGGGGGPSDTGIQQAQPTVAAVQQGGSGSDYFTEDFNGTLSDWKQFLTSGQASQANLSIKDGRLVFDIAAKNTWVYTYYSAKTFKDVRIDVTAENRGQNDNNVSLICRYSEDEGWYEFNVANSGLYQILYGKWDADKRKASYSKIADGGSNKIHVGKEVNDYAAICQGRTLTLMINGSQVNSVDDNQNALRDGYIGLGVSSFAHVPVTVEVESYKASQP